MNPSDEQLAQHLKQVEDEAQRQAAAQGSANSNSTDFLGGALEVVEIVFDGISSAGTATVECAGAALECVGEIIGAVLS